MQGASGLIPTGGSIFSVILCGFDVFKRVNLNLFSITSVVPYIQGTGEKFKEVCQAKGIQVHFKGTNTLKSLLVTLKDKDS